MTTKQAISNFLTTIGQNGYSGVSSEGTSKASSLRSLVTTSTTPHQLVDKVVSELLRQDLVHCARLDDGAGYIVTITPKGAYRIMQYKANTISIPTPRTWDQKWRLVSFDIPSGKNKERVYLNKRLHELNFTMLQKGIWLHPYDCSESLKTITEYLNINKYMILLEVCNLGDSNTRNLFKKFPELSHN